MRTAHTKHEPAKCRRRSEKAPHIVNWDTFAFRLDAQVYMCTTAQTLAKLRINKIHDEFFKIQERDALAGSHCLVFAMRDCRLRLKSLIILLVSLSNFVATPRLTAVPIPTQIRTHTYSKHTCTGIAYRIHFDLHFCLIGSIYFPNK